MSESPTLRMVGLLATAIGIVTGIGTAVGWIASGSLTDALSAALPIAGAVFLVGLALAELSLLVVSVWKGAWDAALAFAVILIVVLAAGAWVLLSDDLLAAGIIGLLITGYMRGVLALDAARTRRTARDAAAQAAFDAEHKTCPDCAETIKAKATVCRYCGWRKAPSPTALGLYAATPPDSTAADEQPHPDPPASTILQLAEQLRDLQDPQRTAAAGHEPAHPPTQPPPRAESTPTSAHHPEPDPPDRPTPPAKQRERHIGGDTT